ncbi:MAG: BtpA/SgcQ family protein [Clostridium fessum]
MQPESFRRSGGGVDGILIANEFSLPYEKKVSYVTVAAMGRVVGGVKKR